MDPASLPGTPITNLTRSGSRPALQMMEEDQIKNLDRVLTLNYDTIHHREKCGHVHDTSSSSPSSPMQQSQHSAACMQMHPELINPYLFMNQPTTPNQPQSPNISSPQTITSSPSPRAQVQQLQQQFQQGQGNVGQNPYAAPIFVVPFWTGCPLPFAPASYPQIVIPQNMRQPQQNTLGPEVLRPIQYPVVSMPQPVGPNGTQIPTSYSVPSTPGVVLSDLSDLQAQNEANKSKEEALSKYRQKRAKRKWSRPPNPVLSKIASARARDENGKFIKCDVNERAQEYEKQLSELQNKLKQSEFESMLLREKLNTCERELSKMKTGPNTKFQEDDMYIRTVFRNQVEASVPQCNNPAISAQQVKGEDSTKLPYNPFQPGNFPSEPFREKIDFSQKRHDLRQIKPTQMQIQQSTQLLQQQSTIQHPTIVVNNDFPQTLETSWDTLERLLEDGDSTVMEI